MKLKHRLAFNGRFGRWPVVLIVGCLLFAGGFLIWQRFRPAPVLAPEAARPQQGLRMVFSPEKSHRYLAAACSDGRLRIWETATRKELVTRLPSQWPLHDLAWTADGLSLVTGGFEQHVLLWSLRNSQSRKLPMFDAQIVSLAMRPRKPQLLIALSSGTLLWMNLQNGDQSTVSSGHQGLIKVVRYSPNGDTFATGGTDRQLIWHDAESRQVLHRITAHNHEISCLEFRPDGQRVATGSWDRQVRIWEQSATMPSAELQHPDGVAQIGWSGNELVSSCWDGRLRTWNPDSEQILDERPCLSDSLEFACWPDGSQIAEVDRKGTLQITPQRR